MSDAPRVRIAPSPSGYFHVGTARTAIYNFLFARHYGGTFLLRIEDTDADRSHDEFVDVILDGLRWLGIVWDEEPVRQSQRLNLYAPFIKQLLDDGGAYRCYCTQEELAQERETARAAKLDWKYGKRCHKLSTEQREAFEAEGRKSVVRLDVPEAGETSFDDMIAGTLTRANADIEDLVLARSDGRPLYNFAVVVDDHEMRISHVIRGNDHITNTFKQCRVYEALGWEQPAFGHAPLILRQDKSKVSKRKGDPSVTDYRERGYLPQALLNYLCLLGWSPGDDREVMNLDELTAAFDMGAVSAANPVFDGTKLDWMNGEYIRSESVDTLASLVRPFVMASGLTTEDELSARPDVYTSMISLLHERAKVLTDFATQGAYFYRAPETYDAKGAQKHFTVPGVVGRLSSLALTWTGLDTFDHDSLQAAMKSLAQAADEKLAMWIHPARLSLTGTTAGPGLFELAAVLGRDECQKRLERARKSIENGTIEATASPSKESS
jgi:nondiscriminating glutamyl-tRNA synthetase